VRLLLANERSLFNYAYSLLLNADDARELLQDAAVAMWQRIDQYDPSRPFFPWAARFVYNRVLNFRQKSGRMIFSSKALESIAANYETHADKIDRRCDALLLCVQKLPAPAQTLLTYRYQHDWNIQEISRRTGRSFNTLYKVMEKLHRTLFACVQRQLAEDVA
jgi:RNA polymerase sigma-70 factor (ECF subfamily)